jgi:hypothetical protein
MEKCWKKIKLRPTFSDIIEIMEKYDNGVELKDINNIIDYTEDEISKINAEDDVTESFLVDELKDIDEDDETIPFINK